MTLTQFRVFAARIAIPLRLAALSPRPRHAHSDKCRILVYGVACVWRDGAFVFDETFIHSARMPPTSTASSCFATSNVL
jgi:hypothetical protein